jgi:hypothetical protein
MHLSESRMRRIAVPVASALLEDLTVDVVSVISNPQMEELTAVGDFSLDAATARVADGVRIREVNPSESRFARAMIRSLPRRGPWCCVLYHPAHSGQDKTAALRLYRSRPAWISCCRPANMCFGVMWPVVAVQADVVVVVHVSAYQTPCVIERQRRSWPDALPF